MKEDAQPNNANEGKNSGVVGFPSLSSAQNPFSMTCPCTTFKKNQRLNELLDVLEALGARRPIGGISTAFIATLGPLQKQVAQKATPLLLGARLFPLPKYDENGKLKHEICLEHRHSYIRKNAVFAMYTIYREYKHLVPDTLDFMQTFIAAESDATCKCCGVVDDQLTSMDELLQMSVVEVLMLDSNNDKTHRRPCFINLIIKQFDNNVKLIVLYRLDTLRSKHGHILDGLILHILQVLSSADIEVGRKAMSIVLSITSTRTSYSSSRSSCNGHERGFEKAPEYSQLLIQSIHVLAAKCSKVAASVIHALMEFLGDSNDPSALDVVAFVWRSGNCLDRSRFLQASNEAGGEEDKEEDKKVEGSGRPKVLADRTYATETACTSTGTHLEVTSSRSTLIATSIIRVGQSTEKDSKEESESTQEHLVQVDDLLTFRQFSNTSADDPIDYVEDLGKAMGPLKSGKTSVVYSSSQSRMLIIDMVTVPNVDATPAN
ncbi:uncharacterized protein EDB91DRAFT_1335319 [Suillus paluster]|uniref:uncharacterized protein n=1 Tax=Suillus paluster TaxID=48578 RepID=UPI001B85BC82|nr:uncharacterized protein EDB91DRAFT_1335319 [Suillus paluster]KAG1745396.1 hypothetical protein EDB91DRAFT_1335319 [Suillus paluster]